MRDKITEEEIESAVRLIVPELKRFAPTKKKAYAADVYEIFRRCCKELGIPDVVIQNVG